MFFCFLANFDLSHVIVHYYGFTPVLISEDLGKENCLYDTVLDITISDEAETHHKEGIGCFEGIVRSYIPIADSSYGVYTPVKRVKILNLPIVVQNWRICSS